MADETYNVVTEGAWGVNTVALTYDPKLIDIQWIDGVPFTGYADGTFIKISGGGDAYETVKGADGSVDRINKNQRVYTLTITLKQTSITNDYLSYIHEQDVKYNQGTHGFSLTDGNGTTKIEGVMWIKKSPDDEFSGDMSTREWTFECVINKKFTGGSNKSLNVYDTNTTGMSTINTALSIV